jgi:uncharacterized membrane protein YsdA (DUF1294 family)/cold shock CspA family protein
MMRITGALKSWNEERGIGYIAPAKGGDDVYVHIKAFRTAKEPPRVGQQLSFEVGVTWEGKLRARHVQVLRDNAVAAATAGWPVERGWLGFVVLPLFMALYAAVQWRWHVPLWVAGLYGVASLGCFAVHAIDRQAAARGRWRVAEPVLLLMGLAGGWPGTIVAQQLLHLQGIRPAYRALFWVSVVANLAGFVLLNSPLRSP